MKKQNIKGLVNRETKLLMKELNLTIMKKIAHTHNIILIAMQVAGTTAAVGKACTLLDNNDNDCILLQALLKLYLLQTLS